MDSKNLDYQIGFYGSLGQNLNWRSLLDDLLGFFDNPFSPAADSGSLWALFEPADFTEKEFELAMWIALSSLTAEEDIDAQWPPYATEDQSAPMFFITLAGVQLNVVGTRNLNTGTGHQTARPAIRFSVLNS